jgi:hypothetical protein
MRHAGALIREAKPYQCESEHIREPAGGGHGRGGLPSAGRGFFVWIEDIRVQSFLRWAIVSDVQDGMFLKGGSVKLSRITGFHWSPTT